MPNGNPVKKPLFDTEPDTMLKQGPDKNESKGIWYINFRHTVQLYLRAIELPGKLLWEKMQTKTFQITHHLHCALNKKWKTEIQM